MSTRTFEALGSMLRAVARGRTRCAGDVLIFGPRAAVEAFVGEPVEAVAPVEGAEHGARLMGPQRLASLLFGPRGDGALARRFLDVNYAPPVGSTAALEWTGDPATSAVHLLVDAPPPKPAAPVVAPVPGPQLYETEAALLAACADCEGAQALVFVLGSAMELRELLGPDVAPAGFVMGRNLGAALVAPDALAARLEGADRAALECAVTARESSKGEARGPLVCWGRPGARRVAEADVFAAVRALDAASRAPTPPQGTRPAGRGRLIGESEQHAAVAWAEGLAPPYEAASDEVTFAFGDGHAQRHTAGRLTLPHVGSLARPWAFEGAVRELLRHQPRFAPEAPRAAFFVGSVLCRVWTATGGSAGGPALVALDEGERRADVHRGAQGAPGEDE